VIGSGSVRTWDGIESWRIGMKLENWEWRSGRAWDRSWRTGIWEWENLGWDWEWDWENLG